MSGIDWIVVLAGIAAIAWVNWYFLFASRHPDRSEGSAID